jgi:hypothetical protein
MRSLAFARGRRGRLVARHPRGPSGGAAHGTECSDVPTRRTHARFARCSASREGRLEGDRGVERVPVLSPAGPRRKVGSAMARLLHPRSQPLSLLCPRGNRRRPKKARRRLRLAPFRRCSHAQITIGVSRHKPRKKPAPPADGCPSLGHVRLTRPRSGPPRENRPTARSEAQTGEVVLQGPGRRVSSGAAEVVNGSIPRGSVNASE